MNITILGGGNIGRTLAAQFVKEWHNVFLVEKKQESIDYIEENLDISVINGNANNTSTLEAANIQNADILIAVTDDDNTNILACEVSNFYNQKCKKIVRISDISYLNQEHILSKTNFKIDHIINNEEILVNNLKKLLQFPGASSITHFLDQKITLGGFKIKPQSPFYDTKIKDLPLPQGTQVIAYADNGHFHLPNLDFTLQEYSILYLAFPTQISSEIQKLIYPTYRKIKNLVIFEDGKKDIQKTYYLTEKISKELKINQIRIINESAQKAQELAKFSHQLILTWNITKPSFWYTQELDKSDAFLAISENNEKNILASLIANQLEIPIIFAKADLPEYSALASSTPITSVLSPSILSINQILKQTHHNGIINMAILNYLELEAIEYLVEPSSKIIEKNVVKFQHQNNLIISHLLRNSEIIVPDSQTTFKENDKVLLITHLENLNAISHLFKNKTN